MIISELQIQIIKQLKEKPQTNLNELIANMDITPEQQPAINKAKEVKEALIELEDIFGEQIISADDNITLPSSNILLDEEMLWQQMTSQARDIFTNCELLLSIDSTNKRIKDMPAGSLLLAEQQTGGRGRYGRSWLSPFAAGIYLSISLKQDKFHQGVEGLSLASGVILSRFLQELGVSPGLKWPNDLLASINPVSKLGGVLVELGDEEVIIGIGINYRDSTTSIMKNKQLDESIAAKQIGIGTNYRDSTAMKNKQLDESLAAKQIATVEDLMNPEVLANTSRSMASGRLINHLAEGLNRFFNKGFIDFQSEWNDLNILANLPLSLDTGTEVLQGICRGVDASGRLLLADQQSDKVHSISSGTVILDKST